VDTTSTGRRRVAEAIAALSLATDLGLGQPMAHGLQTCLLALALGRTLGVSQEQLSDTYYTTLLRFVGCTADSHDLLDFAAGEDIDFRQLMVSISGDRPEEMMAPLVQFVRRTQPRDDAAARVTDALESPEGVGARIAAVHCEVAVMLGGRIGLGQTVCDALARAFERWDGRGFPNGQAGHDVPIPVRIAVVARDIEVLTRTLGPQATRATLQRRRGHAYDPDVVEAFLRHDAAILTESQTNDPWRDVLQREPGGPTWVPPNRFDAVLTAFADFADVKTPFTLGHSRGVAELAWGAAQMLRFSSADVVSVRRAGLLHDVGRSGVSNAIWERPGELSLDQWERVRLHPYYTERILTHCECLRPLGALAGAHHERLNGTGYHRGRRGPDLEPLACVLAAADSCQAMLQPRPHRPARTLDDTARELRGEVTAGRLDARAVEAVLGSAGANPRQKTVFNPGGLTDREIEVLQLMARGQANREMARVLGITPKTVSHHVQHIYNKIGVSTRAAAAVFAVENRLL
jgi:HD-GYP domain-containing protein (c-di-GMP phosphodiesterase class II)